VQAFALTDLTKLSPTKVEEKLQAMISAASGIISTLAAVIASLSQLVIVDPATAEEVQGQISQTISSLQNITGTVHAALITTNATVTDG
jgi:ABC-type transporter Mla subunit MlaD